MGTDDVYESRTTYLMGATGILRATPAKLAAVPLAAGQTSQACLFQPPPFVSEKAARESSLRAFAILLLSVIAVLCVGLGDFFSVPDATSSILYLLPVSLAAWYSGRFGGLFVATLAAVLWFLTEKYHVTPARTHFIFLWNAFSRFAVFLYVVLVIYQLHKTKSDLEETVRARTHQLEMETAQRLAVQGEIAAISDREQERIGHELHDGLCQYLTGIGFRAKALEQQLTAAQASHAEDARELSSLVGDAIRQARNLARGLDPIELQNGDLMAALQGLAAEMERVFGVSCTFTHHVGGLDLGIKRPAALALYRICQEAMNNAVKHGRAKQIQVSLTGSEDAVHLRITDDGLGYDLQRQPANHGGMGIRIMHFRADSIGGNLAIISSPGQGTIVTCSAPRQPAAQVNNPLPVYPHA